jgi:hypothetical protein
LPRGLDRDPSLIANQSQSKREARLILGGRDIE